MEYLGFWVTCNVIKPINRKIEDITIMEPPTSRKKVWKFIGVINHYHNIWPRRSHTLAPLTKILYTNRTFEWTEFEQDAFNEIKRIVVRDTLLNYPDFNETFKIRTDASVFRLGAVIIQKGNPISFYSRNLTGYPKRYTLTKIELLSIVETLKEFRTILLGQKLRIYTYHKNLTC